MSAHLPGFDMASGHPPIIGQEDPLFSRLYARIAVLETELRHAKQQAEESSHGARYLLSLQATARPSIDSSAVDDLQKQIKQLRLENGSLRDQIDFNSSRGYIRDPLSSSQNSSDFYQQPETCTPSDSRDATLIDVDIDLLQGTSTPALQPTAQYERKDSAITISPRDHVASKPEPKTEIKPEFKYEPARMTAPDTSMLQGRLEWADESDLIQPVTRDRLPSKPLPPIPIYQPEQKPVQVSNNNYGQAVQPLPTNTGLTESRHCPSNHTENRARNPVDTFTSRPAYARDENWIRWRPNDPKVQVSHRVIITNLPDTITANTLLSQVCGGLIVSCQILPTIPLTGSPSALIRFFDSESARSFTAYAALNPLVFNDSVSTAMSTLSLAQRSGVKNISTKTAHVSLIHSPTFPLTRRKTDGIKIYGHTRCLELRNFPIRVDTTKSMADLMWFLRPYEGSELDFVESIDWKGQGELKISFTSVDAAVDAYGKFLGNELYRGCWVKFARDPCERVAKVMIGKKELANPDEIELDLEEDEEIGRVAHMENETIGKSAKIGMSVKDMHIEMETEMAACDLASEETALITPAVKPDDGNVKMGGDSESDDTAMDTPPSEAEDVDEDGTKDSLDHEADLPVPRKWNKARELELELDYLRGAPGMR